jgi:hypothetical protein
MKRFASSKKPCLQVRRRQPAGFFFSKPTIAVAGNPVINRIAERPRHEAKHGQQRPCPAQFPNNLKRHVGAGVGTASVHQHDGVEFVGGQLVLPQQRLPSLRLQGGKTEDSLGIVLNDPLHRAVAEIADTVEKENWMLGTGCWMLGIGLHIMFVVRVLEIRLRR